MVLAAFLSTCSHLACQLLLLPNLYPGWGCSNQGIEPGSPDLQSGALPLSYCCNNARFWVQTKNLVAFCKAVERSLAAVAQMNVCIGCAQAWQCPQGARAPSWHESAVASDGAAMRLKRQLRGARLTQHQRAALVTCSAEQPQSPPPEGGSKPAGNKFSVGGAMRLASERPAAFLLSLALLLLVAPRLITYGIAGTERWAMLCHCCKTPSYCGTTSSRVAGFSLGPSLKQSRSLWLA